MRPASQGPIVIISRNGLKAWLPACRPAASSTTQASPATNPAAVPRAYARRNGVQVKIASEPLSTGFSPSKRPASKAVQVAAAAATGHRRRTASELANTSAKARAIRH
jgi:hypothetical protein